MGDLIGKFPALNCEEKDVEEYMNRVGIDSFKEESNPEAPLTFCTFEGIRTRLNTKYYFPSITKRSQRPQRYPSDYVFDEDKSVKWNREEVAKANKRIDEENLQITALLNSRSQQFTLDCIAFLKSEYNLPQSIAEKVFSFVYEKYHSCISDLVSYLPEYGKFAMDIKDKALAEKEVRPFD